MRALIVGGGTGGHVIPAIAIANELRSRYAAEVLFLGTPRGMENRLVPAAGYRLELVTVGALKNVGLAKQFTTLTDLPRAIARSIALIKDFKPDVVIGVGGYASGPGMLAAINLRVPTLIFEPNQKPGLANRAVARFVDAAAVQFPSTAARFRRAQVTGVPVRREFFSLPERHDPARPVLLVFGGSQGARAINEAIVAGLPELAARLPGLRILHQTGEKDFEAIKSKYAAVDIPAEVVPFIDDMPAAFARADLLVCRAGAATMAELTASGKPSILVPFPAAADNHQQANAEELVRAGAALMIVQSELTPERLAQAIVALLHDRARLSEMSTAARTLAHPEAAQRIAQMAAKLAGIEVT